MSKEIALASDNVFHLNVDGIAIVPIDGDSVAGARAIGLSNRHCGKCCGLLRWVWWRCWWLCCLQQLRGEAIHCKSSIRDLLVGHLVSSSVSSVELVQ